VNNRRNFLKFLTLSSLINLNNNISFSYEEKLKNENSVILVWMNGGMSAQEFINPLNDSLTEYRSIRGNILTTGNYYLGSDFKELAKIGDKITPVRSFSHRDANHESATAWVMTSHFTIPNQSPQAPSYGSLTSIKYGTNNDNGMPTYVKINPIIGDDAAYMGSKFMGYDVDKDGIANLFPRIEEKRFDNRIDFMKQIDQNKQSYIGGEWSNIKNQAVNIIKGSAAKAFNLELENNENKINYGVGKSRFGSNCLLARRLIESGAKFVNLTGPGGWDNHTNINEAYNNQAPEFDKYLATLINDINQRSLNTLIVVMTEFSRTKINASAGRDHQPTAGTLLFAGYGNHGRTIGSTDATGLAVKDNPFNPNDLAWTIGNHLGLDKNMILTDNSGRPRHIFNNEAKNILV
jgi:hypothetical protein